MPQVGNEIDVVLTGAAHIEDGQAALVADMSEELFETAALARDHTVLAVRAAASSKRGIIGRTRTSKNTFELVR